MKKKLLVALFALMIISINAKNESFACSNILEPVNTATPITTSTKVSYFLNGAIGTPKNTSDSVGNNAKRLSTSEILKYTNNINDAQKKVSAIYNGPEKPSMYWLTKPSIETEKKRASVINDYVHHYYKGKIKDVIVVSMGGNVGTMKLAATAVAKECKGNNLIVAKNGVNFHFLDTIEPSTVASLQKIVEKSPNSTILCLVSQSGTTFETISLNSLLQNGKKLPPKNVIMMIGDKNSALGSIEKKLHCAPQPNEFGDSLFSIPTWQQTGGRWTGNTAEPSFIIAIGGGNPMKWFEAYQSVIEDYLNLPVEKNPIYQSALIDVAYYNKGFRQFYTLIYGNTLSGIMHPLMQNVNESTPSAKNASGEIFGRGIFHYADLAPKFQHDTMAQITDATQIPIKIRILTVDDSKSPGNSINLNKLFPDNKIPDALEKRAKGMQGLNPAQLMNSMAAATGYDAWRIGRPVEFIQLPSINEESMATLLIEQYLRTFTWGTVNNIDVTREMSFPCYKKAFKNMTENLDRKLLMQEPATIFKMFATKED